MSTHNRSWLVRLSQALARPKNREELLFLLEDAAEERLIEPSAFKMIEGVLRVYAKPVRDIMIPRAQMVVIDSKATLEQVLSILAKSPHARFPVVKESKNEVIGMLLTKDLLGFMSDSAKKFDMTRLMRPVVFIPESKRLSLLLEEFRLRHNHLAIIIDEYGEVSGMVTVKDVLEQIVGDIEDEYDVLEEPNIIDVKDGSYKVRAFTLLAEFNQCFHTKLKSTQFDTIGGLITSNFGRLPEKGESLCVSGLRFEVLSADKRKIHLLKVSRVLPAAQSE